MIFPFDVETGEELTDGKYSPNGFKLDLAKSRYLTIDIQKYDIVKNNKVQTGGWKGAGQTSSISVGHLPWEITSTPEPWWEYQ